MSNEELADLIADALSVPPDDDERWDAVMALQARGDQETFDAMAGLLHADDPRDRLLAVDVMGQLGVPERTLPDACFDALTERARVEDDPRVLESLGIAFGHLARPEAVELGVILARHVDPRVRYGAVMALMGHDEATALDLLVMLSSDPDPNVRNWATFGIGSQSTVDTPAIRRALLSRLDDPTDGARKAEIRGEAMVGLASRGEAGVVPHIAADLAGEWGALTIEAARLIGHPALHGPLEALRAHPEMTPRFAAVLDDAIAACAPAAGA